MRKFLLVLMLFFYLGFNVKASYKNDKSSYIVLEKSSLRILEESNSDKQMLIASTVKILTAITVIENYNLDEVIEVSEKDVNEIGSKVYLNRLEKIKRRDLLYALMLRSGNDAASALSDNNSPDFVEKMNKMAKKIGMVNSVFVNASGLDEKEYNLATAYDLAILSAYASNDDTFKTIASTHTYNCKTNISNFTWINKHKLVKKDDSFIWGKTGYTKKSGRVLVSNYKKDNMDLIVVTINDSNDWNHHKKLIDQLDDYSFVNIFNKGIYDSKLDVTYYIYIREDIVVPISEKEEENIKLQFKLFKDYAYVWIFLDDKLICKKKLEVYNKNSFDIDLVIDLFR